MSRSIEKVELDHDLIPHQIALEIKSQLIDFAADRLTMAGKIMYYVYHSNPIYRCLAKVEEGELRDWVQQVELLS